MATDHSQPQQPGVAQAQTTMAQPVQPQQPPKYPSRYRNQRANTVDVQQPVAPAPMTAIQESIARSRSRYRRPRTTAQSAPPTPVLSNSPYTNSGFSSNVYNGGVQDEINATYTQVAPQSQQPSFGNNSSSPITNGHVPQYTLPLKEPAYHPPQPEDLPSKLDLDRLKEERQRLDEEIYAREQRAKLRAAEQAARQIEESKRADLERLNATLEATKIEDATAQAPSRPSTSAPSTREKLGFFGRMRSRTRGYEDKDKNASPVDEPASNRKSSEPRGPPTKFGHGWAIIENPVDAPISAVNATGRVSCHPSLSS